MKNDNTTFARRARWHRAVLRIKLFTTCGPLLLLFIACDSRAPQQVAPARSATQEEAAKLARWLPAEIVFEAAWSASSNHAALTAALDDAAVRWLAEYNTAGELRRKLETRGRGTAQHPFTPEQLRAALRLKDAAKP